MSYWKFGCKWAGGSSFYDVIKRSEIVIGVKEKAFEEGSYILITEGFLVKAIARVLEAPKMVATDNGIVDSLKEYIPPKDLKQRVTFARAKWYELNEREQFEYKMQKGMCQIHGKDIISKVNNIVGKRSNGPVLLNHVNANNLLLGKKQVILYGPPGTGKTFRTKQIAVDLLESISKFKNNVIKENTEASVLSSGANVWIFQGNPNKYNIVGALSDPNYNIDSWSVLQSKHQIKKGDIALLWMAGDKAGIYALCEIISDPMMIKASYDKYWNDSEKNVNRLGVKINLIKNLVSNPIFREEIKNTPGLENLAILKFANATNFMVKNDEWLIIKKLIDNRIGAQV